jgi:hypothetical protein
VYIVTAGLEVKARALDRKRQGGGREAAKQSTKITPPSLLACKLSTHLPSLGMCANSGSSSLSLISCSADSKMARSALRPLAAALAVATLSSVAQAQNPSFNVQLQLPAYSFPVNQAWDVANKRVYVATKKGKVYMADYTNGFPTSFPTTPVLDISWKVAYYGDLGLTGFDVYGNQLYVAYNNVSSWGNNGCTATGVINASIPLSAMTGCPTGGVISRFALDPATGYLASGAQETTIIGVNLATFCTQFGEPSIPASVIIDLPIASLNTFVLVFFVLFVHLLAGKYSFGSLKVISSTELIVSVGGGMNGASFGTAATQPDWGQYGGDPCGNGGAFRTQTSAMINGKVIKVNIATGAIVSTLAKG